MVKSTEQMTPRFLTKVNANISGSKHLIMNFGLKMNPRDHE